MNEERKIKGIEGGGNEEGEVGEVELLSEVKEGLMRRGKVEEFKGGKAGRN